MTEFQWGNYTFPYADTWNIPASQDCQRITPEPSDGSAATYSQDDNMLEGRTMGQFIILPTGQLFVVNGALNGTAGFSNTGTLTTTDPNQMPFWESLASGPVLTPAIYDPNAPQGSRWSNKGLATSKIARMYHSSAILLPDASVLIAGSNPNYDVNLTTTYPTQYQAEIFYPPYFSAPVRPLPSGVPKTLSYGGDPFDLIIPASSYSGLANDAADNTTVVITRGGFTTHAMNMGQRLLQLNNTYTVNANGSITLHVSQLPPNPNLFQPGPAFLFVNVKGVPSNGTYLTVGSGQIEPQTKNTASVLPASVRLDSVSGTASNTGNTSGSTSGGNSGANGSATSGTKSTSHIGVIIGGIAIGLAVILIVGGILIARRRRAASRAAATTSYPMAQGARSALGNDAFSGAGGGYRGSDSSSFIPLQQSGLNHSEVWNASTQTLTPYSDSFATKDREFDAADPYARTGGQSYRI